MADSSHARAQARFQSGLLTWLRAPQQSEGLREMIAVVRDLSTADPRSCPESGSDQLLWRSAESLFKALLDGSLVADDEARQLVRRLERHLSGKGVGSQGGAVESAQSLRDALFAWVSRRTVAVAIGGEALGVPAEPAGGAAQDAASLARSLAKLTPALTSAAELLPYLRGAQAQACSEAQLTEWNGAARALDEAWQTVFRDGIASSRRAVTELLNVAIDINDRACLRLAEGLATAIGCAEDPDMRESAPLRAAVASALELATDKQGPNLGSFAERARRLVERLERVEEELRKERKTRRGSERALRFAESARPEFEALRALMAQHPLPRSALAKQLAWFDRQDEGKGMAVRGLSVLWREALGNSELEDAALRSASEAACAGLRAAVEDLAMGRTLHPDVEAFAALRHLRSAMPTA